MVFYVRSMPLYALMCYSNIWGIYLTQVATTYSVFDNILAIKTYPIDLSWIMAIYRLEPIQLTSLNLWNLWWFSISLGPAPYHYILWSLESSRYPSSNIRHVLLFRSRYRPMDACCLKGLLVGFIEIAFPAAKEVPAARFRN